MSPTALGPRTDAGLSVPDRGYAIAIIGHRGLGHRGLGRRVLPLLAVRPPA